MTRFGRPAARPDVQGGHQHVENASTVDAVGGEAPQDGVRDERYRLISIAAVRAPEGCVGSDWHVYRIAQGENGITGYRRGDLAGVRAAVDTILIALNERRQWAASKSTAKSHRAAAAARHMPVK
jgi:hypothetical protein